MGEDQSQTGRRRVTVAEAAEVLGVTVEAVRGRIKRRTLEHERDSGTVYVLLDTDQPATSSQPDADQANDQSQPDDSMDITEELRDRIRYLERQVEEEREARRRADTILAQLSAANAEQARTIRAIEAPTDERESPESPGPTDTPGQDGGDTQATTESSQAQRTTEGAEHDADTLRDWSGDVEGRRRTWWRRLLGG